MYRYIIFLAVILAACNGNNQKKRQSKKDRPIGKVANPPFPFGKPGIDWSSFEKKNDSLKAQFCAKPVDGFIDAYRTFSPENYSSIDSLPKHLHAVDINADGLDDLIYEGPSGGEPTEIALILNTGKGLKVVFKAYQHIKKITFSDGKISKIYVEDPGCCAEYLVFNKVYDIRFEGDMLGSKLKYLSAYFTSTTFTDSYFGHAIKFQTLNNGYKLRFSPAVDDTTENGIDGEIHKGNAIAEISAGAKGLAFAKSTDKTGRVWWLVQIEAKYKLDKSIFYDDPENKLIADKIGWISSRYVKKID
jgi:hypothetical protein